MIVQEGLLLINGIDMAEYGTFLCETTASGHSNYDALMKPSKIKELTSVSYQERNGEELPDEIVLKHEARDFSLKLAIIGDTREQWFEHYESLLNLLQSGWLELKVPELNRSFKVYLKEITQYTQLTVLKHSGKQISTITALFREPQPQF